MATKSMIQIIMSVFQSILNRVNEKYLIQDQARSHLAHEITVLKEIDSQLYTCDIFNN